MLGVCLLFVGIVLINNGMCTLYNVDGKSTAVMNIFTGGLSLFINFVNLVQGNYYAGDHTGYPLGGNLVSLGNPLGNCLCGRHHGQKTGKICSGAPGDRRRNHSLGARSDAAPWSMVRIEEKIYAL